MVLNMFYLPATSKFTSSVQASASNPSACWHCHFISILAAWPFFPVPRPEFLELPLPLLSLLLHSWSTGKLSGFFLRNKSRTRSPLPSSIPRSSWDCHPFSSELLQPPPKWPLCLCASTLQLECYFQALELCLAQKRYCVKSCWMNEDKWYKQVLQELKSLFLVG